jgi:8-hydroxy-5-deazaflavin:NADPH oxidoreductase
MRLGIIGAGKLGITLAQLALKAGYEVAVSGSGDTQKIALSVKVLTPGAIAMTTKDVAQWAEVIILAIPFGKFRQLPVESLKGKIVIDATNHWPEVDGPREEIIPETLSSSEAIQQFLPESRVVKAFSHMGYHELRDWARPAGSDERKALALASDSNQATTNVAAIVSDLGFEPVILGSLSHGRILEPGQQGFGLVTSATKLKELGN